MEKEGKKRSRTSWEVQEISWSLGKLACRVCYINLRPNLLKTFYSDVTPRQRKNIIRFQSFLIPIYNLLTEIEKLYFFIQHNHCLKCIL